MALNLRVLVCSAGETSTKHMTPVMIRTVTMRLKRACTRCNLIISGLNLNWRLGWGARKALKEDAFKP